MFLHLQFYISNVNIQYFIFFIEMCSGKDLEDGVGDWYVAYAI